MNYRLGSRSKANLVKVHPILVACVLRAIETTRQDFMVFEGVRSISTQREYVKRGVSQTMHSKHLIQNDGYGHAVDLVPWIAGGLRWEHEACYAIADAMKAAAREYGVAIRWGGAWHEELTATPLDAADFQAEYIDLRRSQGRKPFLDSPHFEALL